MKYRYLSLMVLILILSIGAVCAQDAADAGDVATGRGDVLAVDNNVNNLENEISYGSSVSVENDAIPENANISDNDKLAGNINEDVLKESAGEEITVTNDTFYNYFDDEGYLKDNITADTLIFSGEFSNLVYGIFINQPIKLLGENNATLIDIYLDISSDNVTVEDFIFISDAVSEMIGINGANNVQIINSEFFDVGLTDARNGVISIMYSNQIVIMGNGFGFNVTTDGTYKNAVIAALEVEDLIISSNTIVASLPSRSIDWTTGEVYSQGISLEDCNNAVLYNNTMEVSSNGQLSEYDTIYAVHINGDNASVSENKITLLNAPYGYGIVISGENFNISGENTISVLDNGTYACGIDVESNSNGVIENNIVNVIGESAYGIYTANWAGDVVADIIANDVMVQGITAFGMSLSGSKALVNKNLITMDNSNFTTGIASAVDTITIDNNTIHANGLNVGTPAGYDTMGIETTGVHIVSGNAEVINNEIRANNKYAVDFDADGKVTDNKIYADLLTGDFAVDYSQGTPVLVYNNTPVMELNYTLTNDTFYVYFDEEGRLREQIKADNLTFIGEFSNLVDTILISAPIKLLGDNAALNNIAIDICSEDVVIDNLTFLSDTLSEIIDIHEAKNVSIINSRFYDTGLADDDNVVIHIVDSDKILIDGNEFDFAVETNGTYKNAVILAEEVENLILSNNTINASLPARSINWTDGTVYSQGVYLDNCNNAVLKGNEISVKSNDQISEYDTIYAVHIDGDNATVSANKITVEDAPYGYGIVISGENFNISGENTISALNGTYACGIEVDGTSNGLIKHNIINVIGESAYGIYTANWAGDVVAEIIDNDVMVQGVTAFGMSLSGSEALVINNLITMYNSNFTTGIASVVDEIAIVGNVIYANGSNVGTPAGYDVMGIETTGVHIVGGNAELIDNEIRANNKYTVDFAGKGQVTDNYLVGTDYTGDASVNYTPSQDIIVKDNIPAMEKALISAENVVMYYKNGTRYVAVLTDQNGNPLSNRTVTLTVNNVSYNRTTDDNGTVSLALNLNSGNYNASALFAGEDNYTNASIVNIITILPTVFGEDLVKVYQNESQYYATFLDNQGNPLADGTEVTFNINGVMYKRNVNGDEGKAKLNINLPQGEYIITALNPITNELASNNITVLATIQNNTDLVKYYRNESQYVVTLIGDDGNPVGAGENVTFNINGVFYTRQTNESGQAKLNINLPQGNYTITAQYRGCSVSNNIEVLPVLRANNLTIKYGESDQFIAYLVDGQGKPYVSQIVYFNINGVLYNRTTDYDGRGILNIKLGAAVATYLITSSYEGCNIVNVIDIVP